MTARDKLFIIQTLLGVQTDTHFGPHTSNALANLIADAKAEPYPISVSRADRITALLEPLLNLEP